jgi:peroxiredoxin
VTEPDDAAIRDPTHLPPDLPAPVDDGACDHLPGLAVPSIALRSTAGRMIDLAAESQAGPVVVYAYPRTGRPGEEALGGQETWDAIPGARGCTPQNLGYRAALPDLTGLGATVYGLSTQDTAYQQEMAGRLGLDHEILSDADLALTTALRLPTFVAGGERLLRRVTLFLAGGAVEHVVYPVFPPDEDAARAVAWLRGRAR